MTPLQIGQARDMIGQDRLVILFGTIGWFDLGLALFQINRFARRNAKGFEGNFHRSISEPAKGLALYAP
jgi:hypothetical protein